MAKLSHKIHVLTDGSIEICAPRLPDTNELPEFLYRVNHDVTIWRPNMPEVFRLDPDHSIKLTEERQWFWRRMNPQLTNKQWRACMEPALAFTNRNGFPGHHDYINKEDEDKPDPKFDQARVMGGTLLKGVESNGVLKIEGIDLRKPLPTIEYVMARPWLYFEAVNIDYSVQLKSGIVRPFKGKWGKPVYVPVWYLQDATFPLNLLTKIETANGLPSVYQYP